MPPTPTPVRDAVRPTTMIEAPRLARRLGAAHGASHGIDLRLASETFQHTGSFKFRAAWNVAATVAHPHLLTASSGNFGQALAHACARLGKRCTVVMPATSARVKIDAVREQGATVDLLDVTHKSRAARVAELAAEHPDAYVASPYDDPLVIAGNATLGAELARITTGDSDVIIAPIGGGGLTSGLIQGLRESGSQTPLFAAEPLLANDAARSLAAGHIVRNEREPQTIADGARTVSVGEHNFRILKDGLAGIVEVPESAIAEAVRLLFTHANLKAEPTGALSVAALLHAPERFAGRRVTCVISGGNVDIDVYRQLLAG